MSHFREVKAQLKQECIERTTAELNADLVDEVMNEMVADVSEDVFETDVRQRLKLLDDCEKIVKLSRTRRFWTSWKKEFNTLVKLKRAMEEFPSAPNMQSNKDVLKLLIPVDDDRIIDKKFYVNKRAKLTIETPLEIQARRKETDTYVMVHDLYSKLLYQSAWAPLDLGKLVGKQLSRRQKSSLPHGGFFYHEVLPMISFIAIFEVWEIAKCFTNFISVLLACFGKYQPILIGSLSIPCSFPQ